jgi:hypothetical protein
MGLSIALLLASALVFGARAEQTLPSAPTSQLPKASTDQERQNQGNSGSIDTHSGGAPAASPQGDTPPGMQPVPSEANKTSQQK